MLIHIGYHKTATKWLQGLIFPRAELGFAMLAGEPARQFVWDLVYADSLAFAPAPMRTRYDGLKPAMAANASVPVLSWERFSGNPHSGGYDAREIADRLHAVFPEARILAVIREQRGMILSAYKQYVRAGGTSRIEAYATRPRDVIYPVFSLDYFRYDLLIAHYQRLFGAGRVCVLPYEMLAREPVRFTDAIMDLCGLPRIPDPPHARRVNQALKGATIGLKRRLNPFIGADAVSGYGPLRVPGFWRIDRALSRLLDVAVPDPIHRAVDARRAAFVAGLCAGRYAESNRRTQALTGLDLAAYGYEV
ncbi:MAG: sulfotransferase [Alphaproteobacteria bacterium]